jgi:two-component system sensor histidine kinase FlrB
LAHQIRTPLSAAILYASHLKERDLTIEQTQRFSEKISSRLHHLEQQVSDMLVFAKGDVVLNDQCSVADLITELLSAVDVALQANQAQLLVDNSCPELMIHCNLQSLVGALSNLINNALQASAPAADVQLSCQLKDRLLIMTVSDQGAGITLPLLQRLNDEEAFISTKSQGTGLGLAVVRAVAKAHRGEFQLSSIEDQGTKASIRLPTDAHASLTGDWHE